MEHTRARAEAAGITPESALAPCPLDGFAVGSLGGAPALPTVVGGFVVIVVGLALACHRDKRLQ